MAFGLLHEDSDDESVPELVQRTGKDSDSDSSDEEPDDEEESKENLTNPRS